MKSLDFYLCSKRIKTNLHVLLPYKTHAIFQSVIRSKSLNKKHFKTYTYRNPRIYYASGLIFSIKIMFILLIH